MTDKIDVLARLGHAAFVANHSRCEANDCAGEIRGAIAAVAELIAADREYDQERWLISIGHGNAGRLQRAEDRRAAALARIGGEE